MTTFVEKENKLLYLKNVLLYSERYLKTYIDDNKIEFYAKKALNKTLSKLKDGKLSPAIFPILLKDDLEKENLIPLEFKGSANNIAYDLSVICAFFHTSADLIDDVQDKDYNNEVISEIGEEQSLNIANILLFSCFEIINDLKIPEKNKLDLYSQFSQTGKFMAKGQFYDLSSTNFKINEKIPEYIAENKAGTEFGLFISCFAIAIGFENAGVLKHAGIIYGMLAQIFSDYFDIWCKDNSHDLSSFKQTLPIFSTFKDYKYAKKLRLLMAGSNSDIESQNLIRRFLSQTKAIDEFEKVYSYCEINLNLLFGLLPSFDNTLNLIKETLEQSKDLLSGLKKLKEIVSRAQIKDLDIKFEKNIKMALEYINSDDYTYQDTWEVQRWGFLGENYLTAKVFPPSIIHETLSEAGYDITNFLESVLKYKNAESGGWYYYVNSDIVPMDSDILGQILNLFSKENDFTHHKSLNSALKITEQNIESNGRCPTWLSDNKFGKDEIEKTWYGNECSGVMANFYYGLLLFDYEKYKEKIINGAKYILDNFNEEALWNIKYYNKYYSFYLVSRLINSLKINDSRLNSIRNKFISQQKLNGCWNNSPQDTASVLMGLISFNKIDSLTVKSGLFYLKDTQKYDGRWEGEDFYVCPGNNGTMDYYKNDKVTTSICLRAMIQGERLVNI